MQEQATTSTASAAPRAFEQHCLGMLHSRSDPHWAKAALADVTATLADHAHCEKKAAASALSMIAMYPDDAGLVRAMTSLAQEELEHFREVYELLVARGATLGRDPGDPYAQKLFALARQPMRERKLDRLLIGALIEARSCERFSMLAAAFQERGDNENAARFARFEACEAGHAALFVNLARKEFGPAVTARMAELAAAEAHIVAGLPSGTRVH